MLRLILETDEFGQEDMQDNDMDLDEENDKMKHDTRLEYSVIEKSLSFSCLISSFFILNKRRLYRLFLLFP
jgi:hypothetical protein